MKYERELRIVDKNLYKNDLMVAVENKGRAGPLVL